MSIRLVTVSTAAGRRSFATNHEPGPLMAGLVAEYVRLYQLWPAPVAVVLYDDGTGVLALSDHTRVGAVTYSGAVLNRGN